MESTADTLSREPWNKGKIVGQTAPFKIRRQSSLAGSAAGERLPAGRYILHSSNHYLRHFDSLIGEQEDLHEAVWMLALCVANLGPFDERSAGHWLFARHMLTS